MVPRCNPKETRFSTFIAFHLTVVTDCLKCAGNTFVRNVQEILRPIRQFSDSYVDDLAVFSDEFDEHLCALTSAFFHWI